MALRLEERRSADWPWPLRGTEKTIYDTVAVPKPDYQVWSPLPLGAYGSVSSDLLSVLFKPHDPELGSHDWITLSTLILSNGRSANDLASEDLHRSTRAEPMMVFGRGSTVSSWHGETGHLPTPHVRKDVESAFSELDELSAYEDGWKGEDSRAASKEATRQTRNMLRRLAGLPSLDSMPLVGLDEDGFYCLTWNEEGFVGNLSIRGNGLYSFAIRRGEKRWFIPRANLDDGLSRELVEGLTSTE